MNNWFERRNKVWSVASYLSGYMRSTNAVYTNTLMMELYFSCGFKKNIKITTLEDIDIFKALYATKRDKWLKKKRR